MNRSSGSNLSDPSDRSSLLRTHGHTMNNAHLPTSDALTFPNIADIADLLKICIDRTNDAIVITEAEPINLPGPRIVWANRVFYERNGYTPEEILGQSPRILQGPDTDRATLDQVRSALDTNSLSMR